MSMIRTFNKAVSEAVNKQGEVYEAYIGAEDFTPEPTISESADFNCGALCNELEYLRVVSDYYVQSFDLDIAESENLNTLIGAFLNMPRRNRAEPDATYRNRYRSIAVEKSNPRRLTKWAILDALSYFLPDSSKIQIIELFDTYNLYFQVRIEGAVEYDTAIFLNNTEQAYLNQNFVGGEGVGEVISYIGEIIERIRAAGVDFDVLFILQTNTSKTVDCTIGTVQKYYVVDATIRASVAFTKNVNAEVV